MLLRVDRAIATAQMQEAEQPFVLCTLHWLERRLKENEAALDL